MAFASRQNPSQARYQSVPKNGLGNKAVVVLDRGQLVGIAFFAVLTAGLMFALGYAAGRKPGVAGQAVANLRTVDDNHQLHQAMAAQPTQVEMTFHRVLTQKEAARAAPSDAAPSPQAAVIAPTPSSPPSPVAVAADPSTEGTLGMVAARAAELAEDNSEPAAPAAKASASATPAATIGATTKPAPSLTAVKSADKPKLEMQTKTFFVQVGSFKTDAEARAMIKKLEQRGYAASTMPTALGSKGMWHRVRVGGFASEQDARLQKAKLDRDRFSGWIVKE